MELEEGIRLFRLNHLRDGAKIVRKHINHDDPFAKSLYSTMLAEGQGVERDQSLADILALAALPRLETWARCGDSEAQLALGRLFGTGAGVNRDPKLALRWYKKAAKQGNSAAQFNLGRTYDTGDKGIAREIPKAIYWYQKAAAQGNAGAQNNLGTLHYDHTSGVFNSTEALKWFTLAAAQGFPEAKSNLGTMYDEGNGVAQNRELALRYYREAASFEIPDVDYNLGLMLSRSQVPSERAEGFSLLKLAALQGVSEAAEEIRVNFASDRLSPDDMIRMSTEANKWLCERRAKRNPENW